MAVHVLGQTEAPAITRSRSAKVAVLWTSPRTVLDDYARLLELAEYHRYLDADRETLLKINISWQVWYPGCSTAPWQLEGVVRKLLADGLHPERLTGVQNRTVVVDAHVGERNNKHLGVLNRYGVRTIHTYEPPVRWVHYVPRRPLRVLPRIYPDGIQIPEFFIGKNIIHLPTLKTHVFTTMTGAMKNAFGGLLADRRHWTHSVIHETLVDLLQIQHEIHSGIFAVMDGTIAGDGPGPRAMVPHVKNILLASADQVAIDATAARLMGFDPLRIRFLRLAHEAGLGRADPRQIELVGDDVSNVNFHFKLNQNTLASRGQKLIYHGPLKPLEKLLLQSPLVPWSYAASRLYHDAFWYPFIGRPRVRAMMRTEWGALFRRYPEA